MVKPAQIAADSSPTMRSGRFAQILQTKRANVITGKANQKSSACQSGAQLRRI
jgi:hypothetical protein